MGKSEELDERDEALRNAVQALNDSDRKVYFGRVKRSIKDPDTYATLNWFCLIGLHHMYLDEWFEAAMIWIAWFFGLFLIISLENIMGGAAVLVGIVVFELYALFNSQQIVRLFNLETKERIYREIADL